MFAVLQRGFQIRLYDRIKASVDALDQMVKFEIEWILDVIPHASSIACHIVSIGEELLLDTRMELMVSIICLASSLADGHLNMCWIFSVRRLHLGQ